MRTHKTHTYAKRAKRLKTWEIFPEDKPTIGEYMGEILAVLSVTAIAAIFAGPLVTAVVIAIVRSVR